MKYWQPITWVKLWHIDTSGTLLWSAFTVIHGFSWGCIYIGTLMMDIAELLGVKQVRQQFFVLFSMFLLSFVLILPIIYILSDILCIHDFCFLFNSTVVLLFSSNNFVLLTSLKEFEN